MSLEIYLLGQFKLLTGDLPIELPSRPAQSLLAYLVLNAGVTHRREKLAALLWPEAADSNARSYLRQALWRIRKSLAGAALNWQDFLQINDLSVAFDEQSDCWLDAELLLKPAESLPVEEILKIVRLYRGELLPGFYDEWVILERDRLQAAYHQKMNQLLEDLIRSGQWSETLKWGEQWIQLGYSPEPAFRALMRAHAGLGDQGMVSATYLRCVESLNRELNLEPSPETQRLYEQLCRGELEVFFPPPAHPEDRLPSFLDEAGPQQFEQPVFVARQNELARLDGYLQRALGGQGRVAFVTGEAGSGKTALIQEFARRAQESHNDLVVAVGNCNAHTGIGDPYLPFREIMELLTGDVETRWAAGAITREHARRLWNTIPITAQALVEAGPGLIDTFVPGSALAERAPIEAPGGAGWLTRLNERSDRMAPGSVIPGLNQSDLFEQYTRVIQMLARSLPLVLVVDDLQWADLGSISLLFHLGRHLAGSCILIVGAFRPEEIAIGRDGERHPLEPVVSELQLLFGDPVVDVDQAKSQEFVEALLTSEPNRLGIAFRQMLYRQTRGQPLFTIELLRGMQERGDLVQDQDGFWVEGPALDWETLPARVEAVVAERTARLAQPLQAVLRVASVEGEVFTAEVIAHVQDTAEGEILGQLSRVLDRRHRLVRAQSILRLDGQLISSYRFRHILTQKFLYGSLDEVERVHLHEQVGTALEELHGSQEHIGDTAPQLARHFQEARITHKAIEYLRQAGVRAVRLSAYQEGIAHLTRGLELLMTLPDSRQRDRQELELQLALGMARVGPEAFGPEVQSTYRRARELCQQLGETHQLCQVLGQQSVMYFVQTEYQQARELAEEALNLAQQINEPLLVLNGHWYLGFIWFNLGEYTTARAHFKHVIDFYNPEQHHRSLVLMRGSDSGTSSLGYDACCLWCLGYPDQGLIKSQETIELARQLNHPFSLADALSYGGCLFNVMRRDAPALKIYAEQMLQIAKEIGLAGWIGTATCFLGEANAMLGQVPEGMAQIRAGMETQERNLVRVNLAQSLRALAEAQLLDGQPGEGLATLARAIDLVEQTGERHWEAELHRLKADTLLVLDDERGAEANFEQALEVARRQKAKSWELRAATGLARLWQKQGRNDDARQLLGEIYGWFTEGLDTPDLKQARVLLEEIS